MAKRAPADEPEYNPLSGYVEPPPKGQCDRMHSQVTGRARPTGEGQHAKACFRWRQELLLWRE
jgi:hypothetical protein